MVLRLGPFSIDVAIVPGQPICLALRWFRNGTSCLLEVIFIDLCRTVERSCVWSNTIPACRQRNYGKVYPTFQNLFS